MKMRKSGGGGDYIPDKTPTPTPKSAGKYKIGNAPAKNVLRGNQPPAKRGGGIAHKMDKAMPMPMATPAMSSMAPRPTPPRPMPPRPTPPTKILPYRPATMTPPMASTSGLSPMTKGAKKMAKGGLDEVTRQLRRQMSDYEGQEWLMAQPQMQASSGKGAVWTQTPGYARVTMTADTKGNKELRDIELTKPRIDVRTVKPPKPGSTSGGRGAGTRKMAKANRLPPGEGEQLSTVGAAPIGWFSPGGRGVGGSDKGKPPRISNPPYKPAPDMSTMPVDRPKPRPMPKPIPIDDGRDFKPKPTNPVKPPRPMPKPIPIDDGRDFKPKPIIPGGGNEQNRVNKSAGQGAFINGKPAPQSHSLSKIAKSASSGQGAYINGRPAQINKRSK